MAVLESEMVVGLEADLVEGDSAIGVATGGLLIGEMVDCGLVGWITDGGPVGMLMGAGRPLGGPPLGTIACSKLSLWARGREGID